jgi:hypothetical protein
LLLLCFPIIIDARLIPIQQVTDSSLTIDRISSDNLLRIPIVSSTNEFDKRQIQQTNKPARANTTICYPIVGCFDNNEPFNNAVFEVPQSPDFIGTSFLLFTQESPSVPEFLAYNSTDDELIQSSIDPSRWLRVIIHGFINDRHTEWINTLKDELMKLNDVSSIILSLSTQ